MTHNETAEVTAIEDIKEAIRRHGLEIGFDMVGFAPAQIPGEKNALRAWLEQEMHGTMGWMAREPDRRWDATRSLPGTATVVSCALNYYQGPSVNEGSLSATISAYARGEDYHGVLQEKLKTLAAFVTETTGAPTKMYVDTGPLLEKSFGRAAGLGWMGKHTNLIAERGSSWFFLGEILVPMELPADEPKADRCGTCHECMTACPTQAIVAPYVVDSRLCISYLTIELRGSIPKALRASIGSRIYGCDDCQDVCPWNRFANKSDVAAFFPREPLSTMDLVEMAFLSKDAFDRATRKSPIRRAKYEGFLRNVVIALGNSGNENALPALAATLEHESSLVRAHTAWALGQIGGHRAKRLLTSRSHKEPEQTVLAEIDDALVACNT